MPSATLLLAQLSRDELAAALRRGFERNSSATGPLLFVFIIALGLCMLWFYWRNRTMHEPADATPLLLFHSLARELAIPLTDRWLLIRIAREQSLPTPLTLLISPRTLRHHATAYAHSIPTRFLRKRLIHRIARLRRTLFAA